MDNKLLLLTIIYIAVFLMYIFGPDPEFFIMG